MKRWMTLAALLAVFGLVSVSEAKEKGTHAPHGKIVSVSPDSADPTTMSIVVSVGGKKNPHDVTVTANKTTVVTVDGQAAQLSDLKAGEFVMLASESGLQDKLDVSTKPHHAKAKKDGDSTAKSAAPAAK